MVTPNSQPILAWTAKEKSRISPDRFLKLFLIPALIFPFFAGYNPATFKESDITFIIEPIAKLIYALFENTIITGSEIIFLIVFYLFSVIASYIFLIIIFIPLIFLFSLVFNKPNCFAIYQEGIAKGSYVKGAPAYDRFLKWSEMYTYVPFQKNEIKIVDGKNYALMFVNYEESMEGSIEHYINYYLSQNVQR